MQPDNNRDTIFFSAVWIDINLFNDSSSHDVSWRAWYLWNQVTSNHKVALILKSVQNLSEKKKSHPWFIFFLIHSWNTSSFHPVFIFLSGSLGKSMRLWFDLCHACADGCLSSSLSFFLSSLAPLWLVQDQPNFQGRYRNRSCWQKIRMAAALLTPPGLDSVSGWALFEG